MPSHTQAYDPWNNAVQRSTAATAAHQGAMDESCWDDVAMRSIVAMVLYALHLRDRRPVDEIPWAAALWQLQDDQRAQALVGTVLSAAGHDLSASAAPGDPVAECWRWLTRTWDPQAPAGTPTAPLAPALGRADATAGRPEPRWGGMSRGIGGGLPDPAIEVCTLWAAAVVQGMLLTESDALRSRDRVAVTAGPFAGRRGYVRDIGWHFNNDTEQAEGPAGYVVDLDGAENAAAVNADQLKRCSDLRWPDLPEGAPDQRAARFLSTSFAPPLTCAEDLAEILGRASNPEVLPESLRRTIAGAHRHHHLELDWQATPAPRRFTWRVLQHWYQLTEHYADEQTAQLFEVVITRHLLDPEPTYFLVLDESRVSDVITSCTAAA